MSKIKRKWDLLTKEEREGLIRETIRYFKIEKNEEIGILAAEEILDFFLQTLGKKIYDKGVKDSKVILKQSFENLEIDLDLLLNK